MKTDLQIFLDWCKDYGIKPKKQKDQDIWIITPYGLAAPKAAINVGKDEADDTGLAGLCEGAGCEDRGNLLLT